MLSTEQLLFFRNFVGFQACASALPQQEFFRLAAHRTWKTGGKVYNEHKAVFDVLPDADVGTSYNTSRLPHAMADWPVDADLVDQLGGVHISSSEDSSSHEPECETVQEAFTRFLDEQWANNGSKRPVVGSKRYNNAYARFLADEVQALYGTNDIKLHILQDLCRDAKAKDVPSTITACKKVCYLAPMPFVYDSDID